MAKKNTKNTETPSVVDANEIEAIVNIDLAAVEQMEKKISDKKADLKDKLYSIKMTEKLWKRFTGFMENDVPWTNKEALGVIEIANVVKKIEKTGIEKGYVYMASLPLQASHYFLSKTKGNGLDEAERYIALYKVFNDALERTHQDTKSLKTLETELAGLQQGISTE